MTKGDTFINHFYCLRFLIIWFPLIFCRICTIVIMFLCAAAQDAFHINLLFISKLSTDKQHMCYPVTSGHNYCNVEKDRLGDLKTRQKKRKDETVRRHLGTCWEREGRRLQSWEMFSIFATGTNKLCSYTSHNVFCLAFWKILGWGVSSKTS